MSTATASSEIDQIDGGRQAAAFDIGKGDLGPAILLLAQVEALGAHEPWRAVDRARPPPFCFPGAPGFRNARGR
jgi:hypothetical protein